MQHKNQFYNPCWDATLLIQWEDFLEEKEFAHIIDIRISYLLANLKFIKQNYGKLRLSMYYWVMVTLMIATQEALKKPECRDCIENKNNRKWKRVLCTMYSFGLSKRERELNEWRKRKRNEINV